MESSGIQVILPNMIEFIPMLIAFIVVAIILWKFGWPKFEGMLDARKKKIEDALKDSEDKKVEAENLLENYKKQLEDASGQADEIVKEAKQAGAEISKNMEEAAKQQANSTIEKAKVTIEQQRKAAEQDIKEQAVEIAFSAMKKFVVTDMKEDEHRNLIEKYVNEAGSLKA